MLRTLIGETKIVTGTGTLPTGRIAYAPQEAFVWPTTVRENIVLDKLFDAEWYETVIDACALRPDLARMDKGDMTVMADAGGSVSGGQRQRIVSQISFVVVILADKPCRSPSLARCTPAAV